MQATQTAMFDSRAKSSLVRGTPLTIGKLPRGCGEGGEGKVICSPAGCLAESSLNSVLINTHTKK